MSENYSMLVDTADRLFADLAADPALPFATLWTQITDSGFPELLVPEDAGGAAGDWLDAVAILRLAGYHALPAPLGEAILAARLVADCNLPPEEGLTSIASTGAGELAGDCFTGRLQAVAWGRWAKCIVTVVDGKLLRLRRADAAAIRESHSPAGDPRDTLDFLAAPVDHAPTNADLFAMGALTRTALIAGALDAALSLSVRYANQRMQFGQPIAKFQALQQSMAIFAEEAAAVNCAAQAAARALDRGDAEFEIAAAKFRAGVAVGIGHATAHQVHGAIGFTWECQLHRWTSRLVSWAAEFGSEFSWADRLGGLVAAQGADNFWAHMTGRSE
jgi:acyl-CoA dehydrogenase